LSLSTVRENSTVGAAANRIASADSTEKASRGSDSVSASGIGGDVTTR
jgi:hypothetical protein